MASNASRKFQGLPATNPITDAVAVVPSDTVLLDDPCRALWVGVAGNVTVVTLNGNTVTFTGVQAGSILPVAVQRVNATNTTATTMLALY